MYYIVPLCNHLPCLKIGSSTFIKNYSVNVFQFESQDVLVPWHVPFEPKTNNKGNLVLEDNGFTDEQMNSRFF